ncbi:unnamed protein product, partial [Protopolystoma xenopodis]
MVSGSRGSRASQGRTSLSPTGCELSERDAALAAGRRLMAKLLLRGRSAHLGAVFATCRDRCRGDHSDDHHGY